jgi:hypothetical protein
MRSGRSECRRAGRRVSCRRSRLRVILPVWPSEWVSLLGAEIRYIKVRFPSTCSRPCTLAATTASRPICGVPPVGGQRLLWVDLTRSLHRLAMTAICAFETLGRCLESTLSGHCKSRRRTSCSSSRMRARPPPLRGSIVITGHCLSTSPEAEASPALLDESLRGSAHARHPA